MSRSYRDSDTTITWKCCSGEKLPSVYKSKVEERSEGKVPLCHDIFSLRFHSVMVLPIGGIKEKIKFARSEKCKMILFPTQSFGSLQEEGFFGPAPEGMIYVQ